jgi:hypothetical protein
MFQPYFKFDCKECRLLRKDAEGVELSQKMYLPVGLRRYMLVRNPVTVISTDHTLCRSHTSPIMR